MTIPLLPGPGAAAGDGDQHYRQENQEQHSNSPGSNPHLATEEECLAALSRLPALVVLGLVTTAQANTIRGTIMAILQHYRQSRSTGDRRGHVDDSLIEILSQHPELANLLEPLLSAEQIASIMARAQGGRHGTS